MKTLQNGLKLASPSAGFVLVFVLGGNLGSIYPILRQGAYLDANELAHFLPFTPTCERRLNLSLGNKKRFDLEKIKSLFCSYNIFERNYALYGLNGETKRYLLEGRLENLPLDSSLPISRYRVG